MGEAFKQGMREGYQPSNWGRSFWRPLGRGRGWPKSAFWAAMERNVAMKIADCPTYRDIFQSSINDARAKGAWAASGWGPASPDNFEILMLWDAISSILKGHLPSRTFTKKINRLSFLCLFLFAWLLAQVLNFILYFVFLYKYHKNSLENIRNDVKIGIFPIPIAYCSGFWIFKPNRDNPNEIGMVGQSEIVPLLSHICFV